MFDPEKILGNLILGGARRRSSMGKMVSGGVLLGLAGVAMEAVEHMMNKPGQAGPGPAPGTAGPPPPPPGSGPTRAGVKPPPPPPGPSSGPDADRAILMIRAMVAAAYADGHIDSRERGRIMEQAKEAGLSDQDLEFISREMENPCSMQDIVDQVDSTQLAKQVYTVSVLAMDVDSEAEKAYLGQLAKALGLAADQVEQIHQALGNDTCKQV